MTNFGFCLLTASELGDAEGRLHLWVEDSLGETVMSETQYEVRRGEWDTKEQQFIMPAEFSGRRRRLLEYEKNMARDMRIVESLVSRLSMGRKHLPAADVAKAYRTIMDSRRMLGGYATVQSRELEHRGKKRTALAYMSTARRMIDFAGRDIELRDITPDLVASFQRKLKSEGVSMTTISFYMRVLRAIYNKAVGEGIIPMTLNDPFEEAYTEVKRLELA